MLESGLESPFQEWLDRRGDREDRPVHCRIHCADFFEVRDRALLAHRTQIDPNGWFFAASRELQSKVWPTEDYELAHSHVPTEFPEDDLFAGIRASAEAFQRGGGE
jgi:mycothiol S-conjugate amidase